MAPFYGLGSTASRLRNHYEEAVYFFTTKFAEIPGTQLIDLERMKGCESTLELRSGLEHGTPGLRIQHLNHY